MILYLSIYPVLTHTYMYKRVCVYIVQNMFKTFFFFLIYVLKNKKVKMVELCLTAFWRDQHKHNSVGMHWFPWKHRCDSSS